MSSKRKLNSFNCLFILTAVVIFLVFNVAHAVADFYVVAGGKVAKRTVLVSPKSTQSESGTALLNALSKVTDASATKPYLIIIEPGVYDIGSNSLQMKEYVDIQGSGENVTTITGNVSTASSPFKGVVMGADHAEMRFFTVKNTGTGEYVIAVYNSSASPSMINITARSYGGMYCYGVGNNTASPVMTHVTAIASGIEDNRGIYNYYSSPEISYVIVKADGGYDGRAIYNYFSSPKMTNVTATTILSVHAYGIYNYNSSSTLTNVIVKFSGTTGTGIYNSYSSTVKIDHSVISGSPTIYTSSSSETYVGNTRLDGGAVSVILGGTCKCAGVYDENFTFYSSTCP